MSVGVLDVTDRWQMAEVLVMVETLTSKVVAVILIKTSLRVTLAAESTAIEHGGDGGDGGLAEAILNCIRNMEAVLAALLLISVKLIHRVIRIEEAVHVVLEVCRRHGVDILYPSTFGVIIDECYVKLLHDGDLCRPLVPHDGGSAADVGGTVGQGEDSLVHIREKSSSSGDLVTPRSVSKGAIGDIDTHSDL